MRVITFTNQKGGVGKTTSAVNLAAGLVQLGRRVLLIDIDSQANATSTFLREHEIRASLYDALVSDVVDPDRCIYQVRPKLWLMPAKMKLAKVQSLIGDTTTALRDIIEELPRRFDTVVIDSPPSAGPLFLNAIGGADEVIIPVKMGFKDYEGTGTMMKIAGKLGIKVAGILPTFYDRRRRMDRGIMALLDKHFADLLLDPIHENTALSLAFAQRQSIFEYDAGSTGAKDYLTLTARYA